MQDQQGRIFYQILTKVGSNHRYQILLSLTIFLFAYSAGATMFYNVFLFHEDEYQCPSQITNCKQFVCSLPQQSRGTYINKDFSSLITQFGNYRCVNYSQKDQAQSIIYIGGLLGMLLNVNLDQKITKWYIMFICGVVIIFSISLTMISPNLTIATVALFLNLSSHTIMIQLFTSFLMECFDQSIRQSKLLMLGIILSIGVGLNGPFFKFLPWRIVLLFLNILPISIGLLLMYKYIQQTPFEMILMYQPQDSYKALQNISNINEIQFDKSITIQELTTIKRQYEQNNAKHSIQQISWLDVFRYDSLRTSTICLSALNFAVGYQFDASELSLSNYSIDIYYSGTILGFSSILGTLICTVIMQKYPRKTLLLFSQCFCFISSITVFIFAPCNNLEICEPNKLLFQGIGLFIFRFFNSIYMSIFMIYASQLFPSQIRIIGLVVVFITFQIGIIIIPIVQSWLKTIQTSITIIFAIMSILTMLIQIPLKQTFGIQPPQIIEELRYKGRAQEKEQPVQI